MEKELSNQKMALEILKRFVNAQAEGQGKRRQSKKLSMKEPLNKAFSNKNSSSRWGGYLKHEKERFCTWIDK